MYQTTWVKIRTDVLPVVGPDLGSSCLQMLSSDDYSCRLQGNGYVRDNRILLYTGIVRIFFEILYPVLTTV